MWVWRWISMVASAHHTHLCTWAPAAPWDSCRVGYIYTTAILDYEYMGTVRLCTLRCTPDMYTRISIRTMALWRQLGADTMALADPCSTTGWIYITGLLDAASGPGHQLATCVHHWQLWLPMVL